MHFHSSTRFYVFVLLCLSLLALPVIAQDTPPAPQNLPEALAYVPDIPLSRNSIVGYGALHVAEQYISDLPPVDTTAQWLDQSRAERTAWAMAFPSTAGIPTLTEAFAEAERVPEVMGFDLFDIQHMLSFGRPPNTAQILFGDFDPATVIAAHEARGYSLGPEFGPFQKICQPAGCNTPTVMVPRERLLANPFGGNLGIEQPVIVSETLMMSSGATPTLELITEMLVEDDPTLADDPAYIATARLLESRGLLRQAMLIPPQTIRALYGRTPANEQDAARLEGLRETARGLFSPFGSLPEYDLVGFGDVIQVEDEQLQAVMLLTYATQEDAEAAASILNGRLGLLDQLETGVAALTYASLFNDRGFEVLPVEAITDEDTGISTTVLTWSGPLLNSVEDFAEAPIAAQDIYNLLAQMLYNDDLPWLTTEAVESSGAAGGA